MPLLEDQTIPCEICGSTTKVCCIPIMTGDKFGQKCEHPVCHECFLVWYDQGITDPEELRTYVLAQRAAKRFEGVDA